MASGLDPVVQRRRLRVELRRAREAAGLSQREVAPEMDWSLSKLIRIETGAVAISVNDLRVLLQLYRITDPARIEKLVGMARAAKEPAWWWSYRDPDHLSVEFSHMLSYESAASIVRNYQPLLMPGLLQTDEYARATLAEMVPRVADATSVTQVDNLVDLRMERQERLKSRDDLQETAIYLEAFWRIEQIARKNENALALVDRAIAGLAE